MRGHSRRTRRPSSTRGSRGRRSPRAALWRAGELVDVEPRRRPPWDRRRGRRDAAAAARRRRARRRATWCGAGGLRCSRACSRGVDVGRCSPWSCRCRGGGAAAARSGPRGRVYLVAPLVVAHWSDRGFCVFCDQFCGAIAVRAGVCHLSRFAGALRPTSTAGCGWCTALAAGLCEPAWSSAASGKSACVLEAGGRGAALAGCPRGSAGCRRCGVIAGAALAGGGFVERVDVVRGAGRSPRARGAVVAARRRRALWCGAGLSGPSRGVLEVRRAWGSVRDVVEGAGRSPWCCRWGAGVVAGAHRGWWLAPRRDVAGGGVRSSLRIRWSRAPRGGRAAPGGLVDVVRGARRSPGARRAAAAPAGRGVRTFTSAPRGGPLP